MYFLLDQTFKNKAVHKYVCQLLCPIPSCQKSFALAIKMIGLSRSVVKISYRSQMRQQINSDLSKRLHYYQTMDDSFS